MKTTPSTTPTLLIASLRASVFILAVLVLAACATGIDKEPGRTPAETSAMAGVAAPAIDRNPVPSEATVQLVERVTWGASEATLREVQQVGTARYLDLQL